MTGGTRINLSEERLNRGYTIRGLARHLDIPEQSIRRLESGEAIRPGTAKKIADFVGCTVVELLPDPEQGAAA